MRTPVDEKQTSSKKFLKFFTLALFAFLLGCAFKVKLVGQYDEITDRSVTDLYKKTASFFAKLKTAPGSESAYEANRKFYEDAQGEVAALILRAAIAEQGLAYNPLTKNFQDLQRQYEDLAALHKTAPPRKVIESAEQAFDQSFRAIFAHLLYLKWNQAPPEAKNNLGG